MHQFFYRTRKELLPDSLRAKIAANGGGAPTRACGRSALRPFPGFCRVSDKTQAGWISKRSTRPFRVFWALDRRSGNLPVQHRLTHHLKPTLLRASTGFVKHTNQHDLTHSLSNSPMKYPYFSASRQKRKLHFLRICQIYTYDFMQYVQYPSLVFRRLRRSCGRRSAAACPHCAGGTSAGVSAPQTAGPLRRRKAPQKSKM